MRSQRWGFVAIVTVLSLMAAACGATPAPAPTATAPAAPPTNTPVPPTDTPTLVPPTDTPSPLPPTNTPTRTPTPTPVPPTDTPTLTPTAVPPTDTPVPPTETPVPPTATPKPKPAATATSKPKPKVTATKEVPPPADTANQGCYLFENFLGADVTVTLTARDRPWSDTFTLAPNGQNLVCLDPGRYTFSLDAPPPWSSTNGEFTVQAGDLYLFPIRGQT